MNFCHSLAVAWRLFADRDAIRFEGHRYSFQQLDALVVNAATVLREAGVQRGDRAGLIISNVPAFAVWYYACLRLGAIAVSVSTRLTGEEVGFILSDCDAQVVVATPEHVARIADHLPGCVQRVLSVSECATTYDDQPLLGQMTSGNPTCEELEPDEPATILYTSGTTGFPKGVTLSHRNIRATMHAFNHLCQMRPEDRLLLSVPLFHCYGQNALLNAGLNVGATLILQRGFDLNESKRLIAEHQVTKLFGVPTTFQLLLDSCEPHELESVDYCFSAAATLPLPVSQRWLAKFGQPIYEGYGLTETAPFASYNHRLRYVPGSLGTPVDLVEMKIVHPETGELCSPECPGEIAIRGPNVMLGYWNRPEDTATVLRDGWFYSGDIGRTDEWGFFYIVDRLKDMIAIGGQKVFPAEVERVLLEHTAVAEAAVVGAPDEVLGEKVIAFVVPTETAQVTADEIRDFCRPHLASFKVPVTITFRDTLPRNPAGKVLKTELRNLAPSLAESGFDERAATESWKQPESVGRAELPAACRDGRLSNRRSAPSNPAAGATATGYARRQPRAGGNFALASRGHGTARGSGLKQDRRYLYGDGDGLPDDGAVSRSAAKSNRNHYQTFDNHRV